MFKTIWNYDFDEATALYALKTTDKSLTLPDQHMSIQQMLIRHAQGLPQTGVRDPVEFTTDPYSSVPDDDFDNHTYGDFDSELDVIDHIKASSKDRRKLKELAALKNAAIKQKESEKTAGVVSVNSSQSST